MSSLNVAQTLLASVAVIAAPVAAQVQPAAPHKEDEAIVVTAPYVAELDLLAGKSVVSGEKLQRDVRAQIGDSLTSLPGVSATSFTPGASRPVLRGFQGERVRVLTDGIGSIDVSNTSADHAVTIDPLTAERIEVLRGPAVLLFGSQATGGVVNVIDHRIPRRIPREGYHVDLIGGLGSAADERSIGAALDLRLADNLVVHVDGSYRKSDDLRTGGHILSRALRAEQLAIAEEELEEGHPDEAAEALELAAMRGKLPNSATEQKSGGMGLSYIGDKLTLGVSIGRFESDYGVPMRPGGLHHGEEEGGEEGHGAEAVTIGLKQTKYDLRGDYRFDGGFFDRATLRVGAADYKHTEFEGAEIGTVFKSNGTEGRFELSQRERSGWRGASGVQMFRRELEAIGEEAFVPPNRSSQFGLFTVQEFAIGKIGAEAAARYERTEQRDRANDITRRYDTFSAAIGGFVEPASRVKAGVNLSRTVRAPSAEELFSNGPHIATQAFELGDPDLKTEKALGGEAYVRVERDAFSASATLFTTRFDDFIYQDETGEERDELPVFQYFQRDARFSGIELEASARLFEAGGFKFVADGVADYVRATLKGGGPVPRIPPLRLLGGLEAQSDRLDGRVEVEWVDKQDRTASFETATDGFTLVNASLAWRPWGKRQETAIVLSANNIFDVEARRHASFTKDFVPLAGRDIRLSARVSF
ncbi:TonB-dependent receptor [Sphingomonas xanthus]|uniref:TonB-dependent receptor n=1 Tax=Sphingomonas xanthus TaxID=2594473 RepID=A0A516ISL8_9SPHN|nr:TonB-dependent receptor [Sphingomonas xanthus]QDP19895.1 TonB-dependent receptor [Sphingomonas xanthus]